MTRSELQQLEQEMKLLGKKLKAREAYMSESRMLAVRDQVFRSIGRWEMVDAVVPADKKQATGLLGFLLGKPHKLSLSMPATVMVLVLTVIGSVTTSVMAQNSIPGDPLYGWHRAFENLSLWLASNSPEKQAELRLQYADNRLRNLQYVSPADPRNLSEVLEESQAAISKATVAINNLEDKEAAKDYLARLENLLSVQKGVLAELETSTTLDEKTKKTLLAIKTELNANEEKAKEESKAKTDAAKPAETKATTPSKAVETAPWEPKAVPTPTLSQGTASIQKADLRGFIITANGRPALRVGDVYYIVAGAPVDLSTFIGFEAGVKGIVQEGMLYITEITIGGQVYIAGIPLQ